MSQGFKSLVVNATDARYQFNPTSKISMIYCVNPDCSQPHNPETNQWCQGCGFNLQLNERYWAIQLIGQGGFGRTFLGIDEGEQDVKVPLPVGEGFRVRAVRCVIKQFLPYQSTPQSFEKAKSLFEQEALLLAKLGKHPQIPTLLDSFEQEQYLYLVQEFIDGINLAQVIEQEGLFSESQIWDFLDNLLPVIQYIHEHDVIHRDIKPQNIIRQFSSKLGKKTPIQLVLIDFGIAKQVTAIESLKSGTTIGSPEYVAPEQARGKAVFASDLYSLGVTCIYLLTGIPPFELFDVVNDCWAWRDYLTQEVSENLIQILDKLLQNALSSRFQSAEEVIAAIHRIRGRTGGKRQWFETVDKHSIPSKSLLWQCQTTLSYNSIVNAVAFSPDGTILASGSDDKIIRLWDLKVGQFIATLTGHSQVVNSVVFDPDGSILATGSDDKTIKLWKLDTGQELYTLKGHSHSVKSVFFSPDGQILASGSWDKTIKLWKVQTGEEICTILGHKLQVSSIAFSPCGKLLASASFDRAVHLWNLVETPDLELLPQLHSTLIGHAWAVFAVAFSPDGNVLATGSDDKTIQLWDVETGQILRTISGHSWSVVAVKFSPDGDMLISGSWDKTIKLWRVSTGEELTSLVGHSDSVSSIAIHPNGQIIASGSKDKSINLWHRIEN